MIQTSGSTMGIFEKVDLFDDDGSCCPFKYLRKYYLNESRHIKDSFDSVIYDCIEMIRSAVSYSDDRDAELIYTRWCYKTDTQRAIKTSDTSAGRPIYLVYHLKSGMKKRPIYIDEKFYYKFENDKIVINVNIDVIKEEKTLDYILAHCFVCELVHLFQAEYISEQLPLREIAAFKKFSDFSYLSSKRVEPDFVDERTMKAISYTLYIISEKERKIKQDVIDNYINQHALDDIRNSKSVNIENYLIEFSSKSYLYIATPLKYAVGLLSKILQLKDKRNERSLKTLCLFTSILVDLNFIEDNRRKDFENYKQCILIQDNKFKAYDDIVNYMIYVVDVLSVRIDEYIRIMCNRISVACEKYVIEPFLKEEKILSSSYICDYVNNKMNFFEETKKLQSLIEDVKNAVRNNEFVECLMRNESLNIEQEDYQYLIETIEETDYELLTETTLKIGSLTFGPY